MEKQNEKKRKFRKDLSRKQKSYKVKSEKKHFFLNYVWKTVFNVNGMQCRIFQRREKKTS